MTRAQGVGDEPLAVVGMAARFPGARTVTDYWLNLVAGVDASIELTDEDLRTAGVPEHELTDPAYVRRGYFLDEVGFDCDYFGMDEAEAEATDPGFRLLLECVDVALADGGCGRPDRREGVGLFAGAAPSSYGQQRVARNRRLHERFGEFALRSLSDRDFLAAGLAYRLGLTGPAVTLSSACSTGLVAVHLAGQMLRLGECDRAVAAAVDLGSPYRHGYLPAGDGLQSPSGWCRSFDAAADGTVFSSGVGAVVIRRLADALADGDHVYAVVRGSAVNNDGAARFNLTTPGVEGQAAVIRDALARSGVPVETLGFVECHAPGTPVGDLVEVEALALALGDTAGRCLLGSVKPNIGHAGVAAGLAGFIKAVLAVREGIVPPTIHYDEPSPDLDLARTPFVVPTEPVAWPGDRTAPRRCGVNSFGAGGTNAHVVLEQPPGPASPPDPQSCHLLLASGRDRDAAEQVRRDVLGVLSGGAVPVADLAYTLQTAGARHAHRSATVVSAATGTAVAAPVRGTARPRGRPRVCFVFPGFGAEYAGMGRELEQSWPVYRDRLRTCLDLLREHVAGDLDRVFRPEDGTPPPGPELTMPALFAVEYATAQLWASWGVRPDVVLGHSTGEYAAACVAGWLDLESAARAVAVRAGLIAAMPPGAMAAVLLDRAAAVRLAGAELCVAAVNGPEVTVLSGTVAEIEEVRERCAGAGVECVLLRAAHAYHSRFTEPLLEPYRAALQDLRRRPATARMVSTVTGTWLRPEELSPADYLVRHLRGTVLFADAVAAALPAADVFLEVGPGHTLTALVEDVAADSGHPPAAAVPTMRRGAELEQTLTALGAAWTCGLDVSWPAVWEVPRRRVAQLPEYPYRRRPLLAEPDADLAVEPPWSAVPAAAARTRGGR